MYLCNQATPHVHLDLLPRLILTMATPAAEDDYDKLTTEQREIRDKADRAREAAEQASMSNL
jgi:hypothetical protein